MNAQFSRVQKRGLIILVAMGLVASGLALFFPRSRAPSLTLPDPIEITSVRVLSPTFVDADKKLNLNTASAEELALLPGIGPVLAKRIVAYRQEHGPFQTIDALKQVSGIGDKLLERIQGLVVLED